MTFLVGMVSAYPGVMAVGNQTSDLPFVFGVTADPSSFDPLGAYDTTSGNVILNTLEGLYSFDYQSEGSNMIRPQLASDFGTYNDDNTVFTVPLRNDVTWWDGTPFTASDVVWNFERLMNLSVSGICEHASLWLLSNGDPVVKSIVASATYEVEITLNAASGSFTKLLPFWGATMIKPVDDLVGTISLADMDQVIGTGPFELSYYESGVTTTLVRNENYYQGKADIEKIEFQFFGDAGTLNDAMLGGEVTVIRSILDSSYDDAMANPNVHTELLTGSCLYFYHMSVNNIPWDIRKAIQFAFNYSYAPSLSVLNPAAVSPIPNGMEGYNADLPGLPYTDLDVARAYMLNSQNPAIMAGIAANSLTASSSDEDWILAAQSDTPVYTCNYTSYGVNYEQLNNYMSWIGVALDNNNVGDWPTFLAYMNDPDNVGNLEFSMGGWCPDYSDPVNMLEPLFGSTGSSNWNGLNNATIDANLDALHSLPDGSDAKAEMVDTCVTQIIVEQAAALYYEASADLITWNIDPSAGILGDTAKCLLNVRGDKYFYPINFAPTKGSPYGVEFVDEAATGGTSIPGFNLGLLVIASLGASAFLIFRKRN
jgi:ABC-type transport system substrate-binding protein